MGIFGGNKGLLGLGGFGGGQPQLPEGMLQMYDPAEMRRAQVKQMLLSAGVNMLAQGPSDKPIGFMDSIGQGLGAGVQAAQQTGNDYRDMAFKGYQMKTAADEQKYQHGRDSIADSYKNKQLEWEKLQQQHQQGQWSQEATQRKQWDDYVKTLPPEQQGLARMAPDKFIQQASEKMFNTNKNGGVEYGLAPIWLKNPQTNKWMLVQPSKDGSAPKPMQFPDGYDPTPTTRTLDDGTGFVTIPTRGTPEPIGGVIPKNVADEAAQKKIGENKGDRVADAPRAKLALDNARANLREMKTAALNLKASPGLPRATGNYSMFPSIPGGDAASTEADLDTLKAKVGFNALQAMRDASKTGGALGSIAVQELSYLQNSIASLDPKQGTEQFMLRLQQIADYTDDVMARLDEAYATTYGGQSQPTGGNGGGAADPLGIR